MRVGLVVLITEHYFSLTNQNTAREHVATTLELSWVNFAFLKKKKQLPRLRYCVCQIIPRIERKVAVKLPEGYFLYCLRGSERERDDKLLTSYHGDADK